MRVLFLTPYFPPEGGGLERYALEMAGELSRDHQVRVLTLTRRNPNEGHFPFPVERVRTGIVLSNTPLSLRFLLRAVEIANSWRPDLIVVHTPVPFAADVGVLVSILKSIPLVVVYHTLGLLKGSPTDLLARLYSATIERLLFRRASLVVSVSPEVRDFLEKKGVHSVVIPPTLRRDLRGFTTSCSRKGRVILFVGSVSKGYSFKGLDLLLRSFLELSGSFPEWQLWVVGGGGLLDDYRRGYGKSRGVRFLGRIDEPAELAEIYSKASILVLPSSFESFGLAVLEGMHFGAVPVLSPLLWRRFSGFLPSHLRPPPARQKTELVSALNEAMASPKALKKECHILKRASEAVARTLDSMRKRTLLGVKLLEKF
ncbi:glycosyltransferase family 4 protein [Thermococcus sp.]